MQEFLVAPEPDDPALTREVAGIDHTGARVVSRVPVERALTVFLNSQEIVTMMTIGDRPDISIATLSAEISTPMTSCPSSARQPQDTTPT